VDPAPSPALRVTDLTIAFPRLSGLALAADRVNFELAPGRTLGLVGESGSGKSTALRALIGLVPTPGEVIEGRIEWGGRDLTQVSEEELVAVRSNEIAMIFQDPMASLSPVFAVGEQVAETVRVKLQMDRREAAAAALELLERVGIPSAAKRYRDYPHQLSGGMRQRVMIAIAIACRPKLLLADEPTTALDVTIQDQILALLLDLQSKLGMAMILVSHDLGVISQTCDDVAVMYAGHIVEYGPCGDVIAAPRHPYTRGLMAAAPSLEQASSAVALAAIPGQPPDLSELPPGCPFAPRCPFVRDECASVTMSLDRPPYEHGSACPFVGGEER
jgi:oligopeptide/dipeptide ABC transporter ATP-binding protein